MDNPVVIAVNYESLVPCAEELVQIICQSGGSATALYSSGHEVPGAQIRLQLLLDASGEMGDEGYRLSVDEEINIGANSPAGVFYGIQTFRQLLSAEGGFQTLPKCAIEDFPTWGYRGYMLDTGRNYMSLDFLKRQIDVAASYKLNFFHFHPTEYPGWRIESKAFPNLKSDPCYSQDDMRELVDYAAAKFITIIPEIEMPGHSTAFLKLMPHLQCTNLTMCMGNEETYATLQTIISEVASIFPGPYLHIGTDECAGGADCPKCRETWAKLQSYPHAPPSLMAYFIARMNEIVKDCGKTTMLWNDQIDGGLPRDVIVFSWRHDSSALAIADAGFKTVNCHAPEVYFDHGFAAEYVPIIFNWSPDDGRELPIPNIIGGEAEAWHDPPVDHEGQIIEDLGFYPRLLTFAERVWAGPVSAQQSGYTFESYEKRLLDHKSRYFSQDAFPYPDNPPEHWHKRYEGKWPPPPDEGLTVEGSL